MGLWWYSLSFFVHMQTFFMLVALVLPFPTSRQWGRIMKSRIVTFFVKLFGLNVWKIYFAIGAPSFILFFDCLREYYKYSSIKYKTLPFEETKEMHISLLRAERNYYISGSASLLCIMVPTLYSVIIKNGKLESQVDQTIQAVHAFKKFLQLLDIERDGNVQDGNVEGRRNVTNSMTQLIKTEVNQLLREYERGRTHNMAEVWDLLKDYNENIHLERDRRRARVQDQNRRPRLARTRFYAPLPQDERRLQRVGPWPRDRTVFF